MTDVTKQYIDMAEQAEELQSAWIPQDWNYVYCKRDKEVVVLSGYCTDGGYYGHRTPSDDEISYYTGSCDDLSQHNYKAYHIWLPRQDELQEMLPFKVGAFNDNFWSALGNLYSYAFKSMFLQWIPLTMEQLLLAFVMEEKYRKVWIDNIWVERINNDNNLRS